MVEPPREQCKWRDNEANRDRSQHGVEEEKDDGDRDHRQRLEGELTEPILE